MVEYQERAKMPDYMRSNFWTAARETEYRRSHFQWRRKFCASIPKLNLEPSDSKLNSINY